MWVDGWSSNWTTNVFVFQETPDAIDSFVIRVLTVRHTLAFMRIRVAVKKADILGISWSVRVIKARGLLTLKKKKLKMMSKITTKRSIHARHEWIGNEISQWFMWSWMKNWRFSFNIIIHKLLYTKPNIHTTNMQHMYSAYIHYYPYM